MASSSAPGIESRSVFGLPGVSASRRLLRLGLRILLRGIVLALGVTFVLVAPLRYLDPPTSSIILQREASALARGSPPPPHVWLDRQRIAPQLALAVIAAEDQKFPEHFGFDLTSIRKAIGEGRARPRGASTISQQVAKNLYLWSGRSWIRKGLEAWLTLALELLLPKGRILEIYLNVAEMGPDVFGAGAASRHHFGRRADELTAHQAALVAACLPNPHRLSASRPSAYVRERADTIRREMRRLGGPAFLATLEGAASASR